MIAIAHHGSKKLLNKVKMSMMINSILLSVDG
jgi:hypothetical protein